MSAHVQKHDLTTMSGRASYRRLFSRAVDLVPERKARVFPATQRHAAGRMAQNYGRAVQRKTRRQRADANANAAIGIIWGLVAVMLIIYSNIYMFL